MVGRPSNERDKTDKSKKFNPYNLFLILILLILSEDVLQMIKAQIQKKNNRVGKKSSNNSGRGVFNILPVQQRKEAEQVNREPKEEKN